MSFQIAIGCNLRKSPYFDATVADGVESFSVYNHMLIPAHFGNPDNEYRQLIDNVVMWDVAGQRQVELNGPDAEALVRYLTPRDLRDIAVGQAKYVPICAHDGTLINDPVLQKIADDQFWLSIADSDILLWAGAIAAERGLDVRVFEPDVSPMGVQGPRAVDVVADLFGDWIRELKYFWFRETELDGIPILLARSGWSKQGGYELYLRDGTRGSELWQRVKAAGEPYGIVPGAPSDIERVESGLLSYGSDARAGANPFEVGLAHLVDLDRSEDFAGKAALQKIVSDGVKRRLVGLVLEGDAVTHFPHQHAVYRQGETIGIMTEAVYSPRLEKNLAIALIDAAIGDEAEGLEADIGNELRPATIATLPFC